MMMMMMTVTIVKTTTITNNQSKKIRKMDLSLYVPIYMLSLPKHVEVFWWHL